MARVGWSASELSDFKEKLAKKYELKDIAANAALAKTAAPTESGGGTVDEKGYWEEIRKRNTQLELLDKKGEQDVTLQGMKGENDLAVRGATEAGALARQKLMSDAERYRSDQSLAGQVYQADRTGDSKNSPGNILFDAIANSMDKSPEAIQTLKDQHAAIFGPRETWGRRNMTGQPTAQKEAPSDFSASEKPDTPPTSPTAQPPVSSGGGASMTFGTNMGTASGNPLRKRKEVLDSFYRSNPGMKRILE